MTIFTRKAMVAVGGLGFVSLGLAFNQSRAHAQGQSQPSITHPKPGVTHLKVGSAFAEVFDYGAHVTQFYTKSPDKPILFLSSKAVLDGTKAIRGGIPLIFPQFGPKGPLVSHGFARTSKWSIVKKEAKQDSAEVVFRLVSNEETMKVWPHAFSSTYTVRLKPNHLECDWEVENTSKEAFSFTAALHSYFQISDIKNVTLRDFKNLKYIDTAHDGKMCLCNDNELKIQGEVDRVYCKAPNKLQICDKDGEIQIIKDDALPDAVVWNPAEAKASALKDFETSEYQRMVCIEPAAVEQPVVLQPGAKFKTRLILTKDYRSSNL